MHKKLPVLYSTHIPNAYVQNKSNPESEILQLILSRFLVGKRLGSYWYTKMIIQVDWLTKITISLLFFCSKEFTVSLNFSIASCYFAKFLKLKTLEKWEIKNKGDIYNKTLEKRF